MGFYYDGFYVSSPRLELVLFVGLTSVLCNLVIIINSLL
jgi:hypothetical protein